MALRSPTPFHSFWGSYATVSLPSGTSVQVGDTAYDTTLGKLVVCTAVGPVAWAVVGDGEGVTSVGATAPIASSGGTTPTISISAATTLAAGSMSAADKTKLDALTTGFNVSFQGEITGTSPLVIGAIYLTSGTTLLATSSALLGTVSGGTATLRLVRQSTATVVATWVVTGAIASTTTLAPPAAVPASEWYVFDLAGSAAGTVSRAYGARLEV